MADELLTLNEETGKVPDSRLPKASEAYSIFRNFQNADYDASVDRACVQDMLDGAPPIPPMALAALHQSYRANLNWGEALADHESALAAYDDLISGVDRLADVSVNYGDDSQRAEWNDIIAEEFHQLLINWDQFHFLHQLNSSYFVKSGLSVLYFEDDRNWQFGVQSIDEFKIPRDAMACSSTLDIAMSLREYTAPQLYRFIANEELAVKQGWNIPLVKKSLMGVTNQKDWDWFTLQKALKNNDHFMAASTPKIRVVHYYPKEFDGRYSHHIGLRDGETEEYLFSWVGRFADANQAFIVFPYGVGTNGCFHSIRGQSHKNFAHIQSTNRLRNAALDGALLRATMMLKPTQESDRQALSMAYAGPISMLPAGTEAVNAQLPNIQNEVMPVIREMALLRKENNGGYLSHVLSPGGGDRTAYEIQAQIAQTNVLSSASLNLFYHPWTRTLQEIFRRLKRDNWVANEPGAQAALKFRARCASQGVPWEAVMSVDRVRPVRAVGYGSPAARIAAFERMMKIYPLLDPKGQANLVRDIVIQNVGPGMADRYASRVSPRLGIAAKIAELENDSMQSGRSVSVLVDEDHFVHALVHARDSQTFIDALANNHVNPMEAFKYLSLQLVHLGGHAQHLSDEDPRAATISAVKKTLNTIKQLVTNMAKQIQQGSLTDPSQDSNGGGAPPPEGQGQQQQQGPDPKMMMAAQKHMMEMKQIQERHGLELDILQKEATQRMALKDAESAKSISSGRPITNLANETSGTKPPRNEQEFKQSNAAAATGAPASLPGQ
ncbi:MAG: hypothetical protein ABI162_07000 [Luteolibacter sp.]